MRSVLLKVNDVFDRRTKQKLIVATLGSVVVAAVDTLAIALVFPLVSLVSGDRDGSVPVGLVSRILGHPDADTLTVVLTVAVVVLFVLKDIGTMVFNWWTSGFVASERAKTSARLLEHFLTAPYTQMTRRSSAELLRTMTDAVGQVFNGTVGGLMQVTSNLISIVAISIGLLVLAPLPTLAVVVYFSLAALVYLRVVKPRATRAGAVMAEASVEGWRWALASFGGMKEIHLRGSQGHFKGEYLTASLRGAMSQRTAGLLGSLPKYMLEILFITAVGLIILMDAAAPGSTNVLGLLALFVTAGFRVLPSVTGLLTSVSSIKIGNASLDLVHQEVLEARQARRSADEPGPGLPLTHELRVEGVTFRYPAAARDVLHSLDLLVPRGTTLALVGGSGAGKTTLGDLLLGLHEPTSGRITVDGVDISGRRARWRKSVGQVPQEVFILDATLAENIAFDQDPATIDAARLNRAVHQAQLDELVAELPDGLQTSLGERGARLSGGQRQRVGIARALYRDPQLLVLDEATSALDNETEHRVSQTLARLHGTITLVVIAHRLSTVRDCDQVVFLSNGRVEASGTFEEVRSRSREFARLVELGSLAPAMVTGTEPYAVSGGAREEG